jgi:outer membrane protein insertion porin family
LVSLVLSSVNPYFTIDGVSRAVDVFWRRSRPLNTLGDEFRLGTAGASVRFGVPFSEFDTVFLGAGVERTDIGSGVGIPLSYQNFRVLYGDVSYAVPFTLGWSRDGRDSALVPTAGRFMRVNLEISPFADVQYLRANVQAQQFWPLPYRMTLGVNGEFGYGEGLGGKPFPVFKNFYGGGLGSVRVFEQNSLGVVDPTGAYIGGAKRLNLNTELYFPVPGTGNDKTFRVFGFFDAGNVWRDGASMELSTLRASAGVGLSWISPVGPLKMSYGSPVQSERNDRIQKFQFQIGTAF